GIEFNQAGKKVAYWMFDRHPGDMGKCSASKRIEAKWVIHLFEKKRPGQVHGVTSFASAMLRMKDLADYDDAELFSKKIQACFTGFVTTMDGEPGMVETEN
ncbi:MAG: phage portal protein, partial [Cyanobacteria bacterium]|nr:phage portal protein [Cyanobacteria bacterium CG_2015-02_32_10]